MLIFYCEEAAKKQQEKSKIKTLKWKSISYRKVQWRTSNKIILKHNDAKIPFFEGFSKI